ncbi:MAG: DUF6666 family protein [Pirellulales bacterium]
MNRNWQSAGGWLMALGFVLGATFNASTTLADGQPRQRAMRALRTPEETNVELDEPAQSQVEQVAWTRPQTRTARTHRPWVDPAQRARMQRSGHAGMVVMRQGEIMEGEHMGAEVIPAPGQPGPIIEQGPQPVVDGFYSGDAMGGNCGCTNGECGCGGGGDCGCDTCGFDGGCTNGCDSCCAPGRKFCLCFDLCWLRNLEISGGVHGFRSPVLRGNGGVNNGNFGFQEGINFGAPLPWIGNELGLGFQVGYQATQNNLYSNYFEQEFFTVGLFHRALCGLQGGVVYDCMNNWYQGGPGDFEYSQVRGEISYVGPRQNEIGFMCNIGTSKATLAPNFAGGGVNTYVSDFYGGFVRHRSCTGGDFRAFVGVTDNGFRPGGTQDRLAIGADFHVPLADCIALNTGFTYLIPLDNNPLAEGWNLGMNLVFYPFKSRCCPKDPCWGEQSPFRPLFNTADNGNFFLRQ